MKKHRIIAIVMLTAVIILGVYWVSHNSNHTCSKVKEVIMPSDVGGAPDDVVTGADAVNICKQQGLNAIGEGGRYIYKF
jgi:hypothetical protein